MQRITTFLWYDKEAEEAAKFYCSVFKNSKILQTARYGDEMLSDKDAKKAKRVMEAMLQMRKIDIGKLKEAYDG